MRRTKSAAAAASSPCKGKQHSSTAARSSATLGDIEDLCCDLHKKQHDVEKVRAALLPWYDAHRRQLPWRDELPDDLNERAYHVWVSEIMCQQTQVATVVPYYRTWTSRWPTIESLASASLDEVNEVWAGLGYYSRARRLHEGAQKMRGRQLPNRAVELEKELPGVGRYTAGAIASTVFGEVTPVVDGNVVRVLSRLGALGATSTDKAMIDRLWKTAGALVDPSRPGDFNQALMELGARVCTPKSPSCESCPVAEHCLARRVHTLHTASLTCAPQQCQWCLPSQDDNDTVMAYPRKPERKPPTPESYAVLILRRTCAPTPDSTTQLLMRQRPANSGLLAGLWEFPNCACDVQASPNAQLIALRDHLTHPSLTTVLPQLCPTLSIQRLALLTVQSLPTPVEHVFSHRHHTYHINVHTLPEPIMDDDEEKEEEEGGLAPVTTAVVDEDIPNGACKWEWVDETRVGALGISTAMKKVFGALSAKPVKEGTRRKRKSTDTPSSAQQPTLKRFFTQ